MPTSSREGKDWLAERIVAAHPRSILDIGPGEGTYATLLRPLLPECLFIGIEIWEPYLITYRLDELYDKVIVGDVRLIPIPAVDVVIMGDVLEHMPYAAALLTWHRARRVAAKLVAASIPIIYCPQAEYDNPYEQHIHTWTDALASSLPGVSDHWRGVEIGTYVAPGLGGPVYYLNAGGGDGSEQARQGAQ